MTLIDLDERRARRGRRVRSMLSRCPDCRAELAVLRVIGGSRGCEYWAMRCTECGGIHLEIVEPLASGNDDPPPAA